MQSALFSNLKNSMDNVFSDVCYFKTARNKAKYARNGINPYNSTLRKIQVVYGISFGTQPSSRGMIVNAVIRHPDTLLGNTPLDTHQARYCNHDSCTLLVIMF